MEIKTIDIFSLKDNSYLACGHCLSFSEAAAICLENNNLDRLGTKLIVEGDLEAQFYLVWDEVTERLKRTKKDMYYAVEEGAYCLAMLIIEELTDYKVAEQSLRNTGIDYWLGKEEFGEHILARDARMEVSGILKGSTGQINQRLKEKIEQSKKSDNLNLPVYVVVVEFSTPIIKVARR